MGSKRGSWERLMCSHSLGLAQVGANLVGLSIQSESQDTQRLSQQNWLQMGEKSPSMAWWPEVKCSVLSIVVTVSARRSNAIFFLPPTTLNTVSTCKSKQSCTKWYLPISVKSLRTHIVEKFHFALKVSAAWPDRIIHNQQPKYGTADKSPFWKEKGDTELIRILQLLLPLGNKGKMGC